MLSWVGGEGIATDLPTSGSPAEEPLALGSREAGFSRALGDVGSPSPSAALVPPIDSEVGGGGSLACARLASGGPGDVDRLEVGSPQGGEGGIRAGFRSASRLQLSLDDFPVPPRDASARELKGYRRFRQSVITARRQLATGGKWNYSHARKAFAPPERGGGVGGAHFAARLHRSPAPLPPSLPKMGLWRRDSLRRRAISPSPSPF